MSFDARHRWEEVRVPAGTQIPPATTGIEISIKIVAFVTYRARFSAACDKIEEGGDWDASV